MAKFRLTDDGKNRLPLTQHRKAALGGARKREAISQAAAIAAGRMTGAAGAPAYTGPAPDYYTSADHTGPDQLVTVAGLGTVHAYLPGDMVTLASSLAESGAWTFAFWFKADSVTMGESVAIASFTSNNDPDTITIAGYESGNPSFAGLMLYIGSAQYNINNYASARDVWHLLVVQVNGSDVVSANLDGVNIDSAWGGTNPSIPVGGTISINTIERPTGAAFWASSLTPSEITALYAATTFPA